MPPRGYHQNFVSFIYLCYDKIRKLYFLETNEVPVDIDGEFTAKFVFELQARHGCYDMGKFMSSIKNSEELSNLSTDVFARWIIINQEHLTHLPETIWDIHIVK
jgi:hypothetical protein